MHLTLGELAFLILAVGGVGFYGLALFFAWLYVSAFNAPAPRAKTAPKVEPGPTAPPEARLREAA